MIAASSVLRRRLLRSAGPHRAEVAGKRLRRVVARAGEGEDAPALVARDLSDDVRRGAEPEDAEIARIARHDQRAVADQPGAQERRRFGVARLACDREAESRVGDRVFLVSAIDLVAGKARLRAQILAPRAAEPAFAAAPAEPRHADPLAQGETLDALAQPGHPPDDLVAGHDRQSRVLELAVHNMEVGAAHAACGDLDQHLAPSGYRDRTVGGGKLPPRRLQHHRAHGPPPWPCWNDPLISFAGGATRRT